MEALGLVSLIGSTVTLTIKVSLLVTDLQSASDDFDDIRDHFDSINAALDNLKMLFISNSLPPALLSGYARQLEKYRDNLNDIATRLESIQQGLGSKSRFDRLWQRHNLVHGDLKRLTNRISAINTGLNTVLITYGCIVINLVHRDVNSWRAADINLSGYGEIQPETDRNKWVFNRGFIMPPELPSSAMAAGSRGAETPGESIPMINANTEGNFLSRKPSQFLLKTINEIQAPAPSIVPWVGEYLLDSKMQSPPPSPGIPQEETFQLHGLRCSSSLPDIKKVQDIGCWMLKGMQGYEYNY